MIPEEQIALRELEIIDIILFGESQPGTIGYSEEPASPRALLIGDGRDLVGKLQIEYLGICNSGLVRG